LGIGTEEARLITIGAIALIVGGLLARRFSIFVLLPGIVIAGAMSLLIAVVSGGAVADALWMALIVAMGLQLGFLAGAVLNGVFAQRRAGGPSWHSTFLRRPW
jgi:hypothetical protein